MRKKLLAIFLAACMAVSPMEIMAQNVTAPIVSEEQGTDKEDGLRASGVRSTDINVNTGYRGQLMSGDDSRQYNFTLSKAGKVSISFSHENLNDKERYWRVYLYNAKEDEVVNLDSAGIDLNKTSAEVGLPAGKYSIKVKPDSRYRYSTKEYQFKINYSAADNWEKESNDSLSEATAVSVNKDYYGANQYWNDEDYYKFTLSRAGKVSIDFNHKNLLNAGRFWVVHIYNEFTDEVVWSDIGGAGTKATSAEVGLPAGTYYVKINTDSGERNWYVYNSSDATYSFKINYQASEYWEREKNDSYSNATKISLGKIYYGANQYWNDIDYYKFTLCSAGKVSINFKHKNLNDKERYWVAHIYNEKTAEVLSHEITGTDINSTSETVTLRAGTYYVKINTDSGERNWYRYNSSDATYNFQVKYDYFIGNPSLKATAPTYNRVDLSWKKVSGAGGYEVYRSTGSNGAYKKIKTVTGTSKYTDKSVVPGKTYYYRVRAYRKLGTATHYSAYSPSVKVKAQPPQIMGTSVKAGTKRATVTWKRQKDISGYEVWMSTRKNSGYKRVKAISRAATTKYVKTGLKKGGKYYFKVRSYKIIKGKKIYGDYSTVKVVRIKR